MPSACWVPSSLFFMRLRTRTSKPSIRYCTTLSNQVSRENVMGTVRGVECGMMLIPLVGFLLYCLVVVVFATVMIYKVAPTHGKKNPLIYLSICSTVGSVSVMSVKAFGIALKLTFAGNNQFTHPSTYVFMILTSVCILTQMNYFNKALSQFSTQM